MSVDIRYTLYWKELFQYISSMTIKFGPFAEIIEKHVTENTDFTIGNTYENPYYRNICGLYSFLDTPMVVMSVETNQLVSFDRDLWNLYPKTASLYAIDSEAHERLCLEYPNQIGLIKHIMYPCKNIDEAINAPELTILYHDPTFLRQNERETLHNAAIHFLTYIRDRWFIRDYTHENQYPLAFMSKVYTLLFSCLIKQRLENCDTYTVHPLHVWDRLTANGLGAYESILNDHQSRWFYRNMRYLKENRGRKSNLILLADNLLKDLRVHLVGKRIFQQTVDLPKDCILVPEFLSEEIVDYSLIIPESLAIESSESPVTGLSETSSTVDTPLLDRIAKESMDGILNRVFKEGYYPQYSIDNSVKKEDRFGKTLVNTVPTRLLEFQKYIINTQYLKMMSVFLFDSLMYQYSQNNLQYRLVFKDNNTNIPMNLSIEDSLVLLHYVLYRRYEVEPEYLPEKYPADTAYKKDRPRPDQLPTHFFFNKYNYQIKTLIEDDKILSDIPWSNDRFNQVEDFIQILGLQFNALIKHTRDVATAPYLTYQWAMWYYYKFLFVNETVTLQTEKIPYTTWLSTTPGISDLISAYDSLPNRRVFYDDLMDNLIRLILPIEFSPIFLQYAGAIYDDTAFYDQLKQLFSDWTSHDLTYLDTDRAVVTYLDFMPTSVMTSAESNSVITDFTDLGVEVITDTIEVLIADLRDEDSVKPTLNDVQHSEESERDETTSIILKKALLEESSDQCFYDRQDCIVTESTESTTTQSHDHVIQSSINEIDTEQYCQPVWVAGTGLIGATIPGEPYSI